MYIHFPNNRGWSFYVQRLIDEAAHGVADFNECHRTLGRIPEGDREAWYDEWARTRSEERRVGKECRL